MNERSNRPSRCAGVVATACTQGKRTQHGKPQGVIREDQPDAREGQAGRPGVAESYDAVVGPPFGRASSDSFHGFPYFLRLGDDVIRDGVPFVLGHGLPEAAYHLSSASVRRRPNA